MNNENTMRTLVITSARIMLENNLYYVDNGLKITIDRYSRFFGEVTLFGMDGSDKGKRSSGSVLLDNVDVKIMGSLKQLYLGKADKMIEEAIPKYDLIILRVPSMICDKAASIAKKNKRPYFVEVIGDAFGALWYHSVKGKLLAIPSMINTKKTIKNADYAVYVSDRFLQSKYPCDRPSIGVSDCIISEPSKEMIQNRISSIKNRDYKTVVLMNAAAIDVKYKGQEYVIKAIPLVNRVGIRVKFYIVGNGNQAYLKRIAEQCGVLDQVVFTGGVSHDDVFRLMSESDIYIQPSLTEALARSVVEALSTGCCCIGTDTGGLIEVIGDGYRFKPRDYTKIANIIIQYVQQPKDKKIRISKESFARSCLYSEDTLNKRREDYYKYVYNDLQQRKV